jgi:hypothetical protein
MLLFSSSKYGKRRLLVVIATSLRTRNAHQKIVSVVKKTASLIFG